MSEGRGQVPEQNTSPNQQGTAVRAAAAAADAAPPEAVARQLATPARPFGRRRIEPAVAAQVEPVSVPVPEAPSQAAPGLTALPGAAATAAPATPVAVPRPGRINAPLRIIAAVAGAVLMAVPFATAALTHARPPAPKPRVATFRVVNRDVRTFWPVPGAAGR